jgi:hypothetical protein
MTRRRIGPHRDRPHYVIARAFHQAPRLFRVTGQNHVTRRLFGTDLATGEAQWLPMDDALATHEDEREAQHCFDHLCRELPAIDGAVYRARRALEDAELTRRRTLREIAIGTALARA